MSGHVFLTGIFGVGAAVASLIAYHAATRLKTLQGRNVFWVAAFWLTVATYMLFFSAIRIASGFGASDGTLTNLFFLQTCSGAATIISLSAIVLQVTFRPWFSGFGTGVFLSLAALAVYLVIVPGPIGPIHGTWSTEFLPRSVAARVLIGAVYNVIPVIFAGLIWWATQDANAATKRRLRWFAVSVVMMYLPNASKYVVLLPDFVHVILALIMMVGAFIGWRSYVPATNGRQA